MNRMKMLSSLLVLAILVNLLILGSVMGDGEAVATNPTESVETVEQAVAQPIDPVSGMRVVAENEFLTLYFDTETTEVAVKDKKSDYVWQSNPPQREEDAIASGPNKAKLSSQLTLAYYNAAGLMREYDSFTDSVREGQFESDIKDGVLSVHYTIGDMSLGIDVVPKRISVERMESKILSKLQDESVRRDVLKRFKLIEAEQVYERRDNGIQEVHLKRLMNVFAEVDYTLEDVRQDNADNGFNSENVQEKPLFSVTVEYRLDGPDLLVTVPGDKLKGPSAYVLQSLRLLEYFGAAGQARQGYMFVPDGSGALIHLNNGKLKADRYQAALYGTDNSRYRMENRQYDEVSRLPVFGLKQDDNAFLAIIEKGDALSSIEADISGRRHAYNTVFSSYQLTAKDELTLTGNATTQTTSIFQTARYEGDIQVRYGFLSGDSADYSGMAAMYRDYLVNQHQLDRLPEGEDLPFFLELVGAITKKKSMLGIPYQSLEPLTTFKQAQEIMNQMKEDGIGNIQLRYTGWFNKGINHKAPSKLSVDKPLGGARGLAELADYASENDVRLYPDTAFSTIYGKSNGFSPSKEAARFINRSPVKLYPYSRATYEWDKTADPYYILSGKALPDYVQSFMNQYEKQGISGLSLRDLGRDVNADYRDKGIVDRQQTKDMISEQIAEIDRRVEHVMVVGGNAMSLPYADSVVFAPLTSSKFDITDESVPFYGMVIHGYIDYAGEPLNVMEDQNVRKNMLKLLETGAGIYYQWYYAPSHAVKETRFNDMFASHYGDWIAEAADLYQELSPMLRDLRAQTIVRHEKLAEGVFETTYEGGASFIVNYNKEAVQINGARVEALSYVQKGGA
ncbi:DUF5696 domain-containing protein [Paenibacillus paeoniae]|uniref:Uncharacterized protein n=1 Tax=Paenibacillus paeoniae TaxID=2292705 RepID=A0A371PHD2_9BACL|nr:DUF5696 domain-containing protein [Paenibacillus paeoniae]REK74790.1 hypothetical protein DX130_14075 [Paenibacillus paeoniae]